MQVYSVCRGTKTHQAPGAGGFTPEPIIPPHWQSLDPTQSRDKTELLIL